MNINRKVRKVTRYQIPVTRESSRVFRFFFWFLVTGFWFLLAANAFASVSRVEFYRDGTKIGEDTSAPYSLSVDTTSTTTGSHTFSAKAYDSAGNVTTSSMNTVNVSNAPINSTPFVKGFGGTGEDSGKAVTTDSAGNTYVAGTFYGTANFDSTTLNSKGGWDLFIAKYSPSGAKIWVKGYGGSGNENFVKSIAVDSSGNVYLGGFFLGTGNFGGANLTSAGSYDMFLAKYSPQGDPLWSQKFGGTLTDQINGIAVDSQGNVIVAGTFQGRNVSVGGAFWNSKLDGTDLFIAKYSPQGLHMWSKTFENEGDEFANALALDGSDNIFISGYTYSLIDFGGGLLIVEGGDDIFLAKFSSSGDYRWAKNYGGASGGQRAYALTVDSFGDAVVTGDFNQQMDPGNGNLLVTGKLFVVKYSGTDGSYKWAKSIGGLGGNRFITDLATDGGGNIFVIGGFSSDLDFGAGVLLASTGETDVMLVKYSPSGVLTGAEHFGGSTLDSGSAIAVDPTGLPVITGSFSGTADFRGQTRISAGSNDIFLVKLDPTVGLPSPDTTQPSVSIDQPTNGSTVSGTISLQATATDNIGVRYVEFYLDSATTPFGVDSTYPYNSVSLNTPTISNGSHMIKAKAADLAGNSNTASITVNVSN